MTDRCRRPEPATLEAHPVRKQVCDRPCARSRVLLRHAHTAFAVAVRPFSSHTVVTSFAGVESVTPCCRSDDARSPTKNRTGGDGAGVKKTQLGPESTQRNGLRGSCYEVGENRPAGRSTTGRPGERRSETRELDRQRPGMLREGEAASQLAMADRRVVKLRPVPQEPCRRREEPASVQGALRPGCPRGRSERRSNRCECVLRGDLRESEAQSFRSDPWAAVRRARLNPMQPVPDSGDGNPPGF